MKSNLILFVLCLVFSVTAGAQTIPIHKTKGKISIDGDLADWKTPFKGPFVIHNSGGKATQLTTVSFAWDDENLYVAYRSQDAKIVGSKKQNDSQIFNSDDLVEIFIDPDGDRQNYLEIGVNAFSTHYDMLIKCISPGCGGWNTSISFNLSGMQAVSKITPKGFSTEIKIPFSGLKNIPNGNFNKPKIGTKWKGNAFRIDYGNTTEYLALQPYKNPVFGFHKPEEFAVLEFVE